MGNVVLLVDDEEAVRTSVSDVLTKQSESETAPVADEVIQAGDTAQAIEKLREHAGRINRIIVDASQNGDHEAGIKLIRQIRKSNQVTPILLLSISSALPRMLEQELKSLNVQFTPKSDGITHIKQWITDPNKEALVRRALL